MFLLAVDISKLNNPARDVYSLGDSSMVVEQAALWDSLVFFRLHKKKLRWLKLADFFFFCENLFSER